MDPSLPPGLHERLTMHFTGEELERIRQYLQAESWASPSSRWRRWSEQPEEIPLRFHLDIDMKV
ncbi:hypothetical protein [Paludifilum halophilum]|uniref:Uncharacterized protein n=1 Tax=Paludifilum halophilum TaxID=1642702 RepID=A0A235BDJ7_9BACL|nr:hypothetical protein [Paludifilum halophilum]OYD09665.1 hypothetical protein CHM34_01275 [Paludifilum halophilum]